MAAPSKGSSTIASTPSLMKVSTWLICVPTSLVPSATWSSTSPYSSAAARAASVMPAIQPWSAAGAEKPMVTVSPSSSFELAAFSVPPPPEPWLSGSLLVQPATRAPAPTNATAVVIRRRVRSLAADMCLSSVRCTPAGGRDGWVGGWCGQVAAPGRSPPGAPGTLEPPETAPDGAPVARAPPDDAPP